MPQAASRATEKTHSRSCSCRPTPAAGGQSSKWEKDGDVHACAPKAQATAAAATADAVVFCRAADAMLSAERRYSGEVYNEDIKKEEGDAHVCIRFVRLGGAWRQEQERYEQERYKPPFFWPKT